MFLRTAFCSTALSIVAFLSLTVAVHSAETPKKPAAKPVKTAKAHPAKAPAKEASALIPLSDEALALSEKVYVGRIPCELGQTVTMTADQAVPGYFHLHTRDQVYHLRPVVSATGAVRLEDEARGAVWIQLGNKSMLMNQKLGRRLADDCMSPVQQAVADQLKINPAPNLLDLAQKPR